MNLLALKHTPEAIAAQTGQIHQRMRQEGRCVGGENFESIGTGDLARLFKLYDDLFFANALTEMVTSMPGATLGFRLSSTMTRAGGKTIRQTRRLRGGGVEQTFEIAIATRMLFMNFRQEQRPVTVCGLICNDRLSALQRIMEHEILHLAEFLAWGKSSCNRSRFKGLAQNIFGHAASRHDLITTVEIAQKQHAVSIGSRVEFYFDGQRLAGLVNRIHHRATVLVESNSGQKYRNGKKYLKYYIPLGMLRPAGK